MRRSNYIIKSNVEGFPLVLIDLGPWDVHFTITNDIENVIKELQEQHLLDNDRPLLYFDSCSVLTEVVLKDGKFVDFKSFDQTKQ